MFRIRGKLKDGRTISGTMDGKDAGDVYAKIQKKLADEGQTVTDLSVKQVSSAGTLKIGKARTSKKK